MPIENITILIEGMKCGNCSGRVQSALLDTDGVEKAVVNLEAKKVDIEFNPGKINKERLIRVVEETGYKVAEQEEETAKDPICGMTVSKSSPGGGSSEYDG